MTNSSSNASGLRIFTICARNYLAQAVCLAESLRVHHPDVDLSVWLIDEGTQPEEARRLHCRSIREALTEHDFMDLYHRYNITEFSTAVKPAVFLRLFAESEGPVCYLDPDIYVFSPMTAVLEALSNGVTGVLTPHMFAPFSRDGLHPTDREILASGTYNLGFIALAQNNDTRNLLDWWWNWLKTDCYSDLRHGTFTDQKWMNLAPCFWHGFRVLEDRTYNVAYWNLHDRSLDYGETAGSWVIDGKPLTFFHFSGFSPSEPGILSRHQSRVQLEPNTALSSIVGFYTERMLVNGYESAKRLAMSPPTFADGVRWDSITEALFREAVGKGRRFGNILTDGPESFREYLQSARVGDPHGAYISRLLEQRPDLKSAFGDDEDKIIEWIRKYGTQELELEPAVFDHYSQEKPIADVAYVGYLRAALGVAQAARGYIAALRQNGAEPALIDVTHLSASAHDEESMTGKVLGSIPDSCRIELLHVNADQVDVVLERIRRPAGHRPWRIGLWAWETPEFPDRWLGSFDSIDELWVGSAFMATALAQKSPVPVINMPYVVEVPEVTPDKAAFGLSEEEFVFLFAFDFFSIEERKNPYAAIAAFRSAFSPEEPVRLLIKTMHGDKRPVEYARMQAASSGLRVSFLDDSLDSLKLYQLMASCDAYVSLHRAEGYGLGMAEAMAYGKPVIATGWSGNMEFMTACNSFPVAFDLEPLPTDAGPYAEGTIWALPRVSDAAEKMRLVWKDRDEAARVAERGKRDIEDYYGKRAIGEKMAKRLETIRRNLPAPLPVSVVAAPSEVSELRGRLVRDIVSNPGYFLKRLPAAVKVMREGGLSTLKHHIVRKVRGR